ncbi:hypothetical protein L596_030340 [Steinernema carpocapsae]|uniref:Nudix hydrolase domain-containing protein n=1 Tax=Steinernema carpocapsae TaxID=34508 RepID=A0A4U5LP31_STECR|nr:hypothetical protein L596_030340 [Steinernema carpocapsae]
MQSLRASLRHHHTTANLLLSQTGKEAFLQRLAEAQIASAGKPKLRAAKRGGAPKKNDSSVLIPLVEQEKRIWIILTQRSFQLNSHRGEICFPGGKIEHGEDLAQAALRESFEETGMEPSKVNVWGALNPVLNRYLTNSVTPVVGPEFVEFEKLQRGTTHELNKRLFDLIFEADCVHFWDRIPAVWRSAGWKCGVCSALRRPGPRSPPIPGPALRRSPLNLHGPRGRNLRQERLHQLPTQVLPLRPARVPIQRISYAGHVGFLYQWVQRAASPAHLGPLGVCYASDAPEFGPRIV